MHIIRDPLVKKTHTLNLGASMGALQAFPPLSFTPHTLAFDRLGRAPRAPRAPHAPRTCRSNHRTTWIEVYLRSHFAAVFVPSRRSALVLGGSRYFTGERGGEGAEKEGSVAGAWLRKSEFG